MTDRLRHYRQVWLVDFEFGSPTGGRPEPRCMAAREFRTGQTLRLWSDELARMDRPPFDIGPNSLFVAYLASAELGCFLTLGWPMPARVLDLYCEFRNATNGQGTPCGNGLLGALAYHGLPAIDAADKADNQALALRGGHYSEPDRQRLLDYCESDVVALAKLLPAMLPKVDLRRALLRGRYMATVARMESTGIPIDVQTLERLRANWDTLKTELVRQVDADYGVYVPANQRKINPNSNRGQALLETAADAGVDPHNLADAVDYVWGDQRNAQTQIDAAKAAARKATGLTAKRIGDWENRGHDHSTWPGLDTTARELAAEYPELGLGGGYESGTGYDDTDYAARLWELLRDPVEPLRKHDREILDRAAALVADHPPDAYHGPLSFNTNRFAEWLVANDIPWPRTEAGNLSLSDDTFRQMSKTHPAVAPLRELRHSLSELRLEALAVGADGRNRCMLSPFRSITGRNQPSNNKFVFGPSVWLRGLIEPPPGRALAYVDWSQQEFGIAAALSQDETMMAAYTSGDPYLAFAKQAGSVPDDATKDSHPVERERFKVCALAVQYGMGPQSLAQALGQPTAAGRELLRLHRQTYPTFWRWSEAAVNHAMLLGRLHTVFGWNVYVGPRANPRSLANFPMQANGAEMLRLSCCLATERGVAVCAPIHDALLVEGPARRIESVVAETQRAMADASRAVLGGFELRTDSTVVAWPNRYADKRGQRMWDTVSDLLAQIQHGANWTTDVVQIESPVHSY